MRIRTVKPEFWMHEGLCKCSEFSRLLALALLNWSDDEGYFMANPVLIRGQLFPFEEDSKKVPRSLQELSAVGWIRLGTDNQGRSVGMVLNFSKHQRVDKPKPSEIKDISTFSDASKNDPGAVQDDSKEERKGKEGKGKDTPLPPKGDEDGGENHILPKNWKQLSGTERKQTRVNKNSQLMNRIGSFFGRKAGTLWTVAEAVALKNVMPSAEEVLIVETYYLDDSIEKDSDYRRKDLITLLNNWSGELDRARVFLSDNNIKLDP